MKPTETQGTNCRHFNGIQHDTCEAGVAYNSVRDESTRPFGFPCLWRYAGNATCPSRNPYTLEEVADAVSDGMRRHAALFNLWL